MQFDFVTETITPNETNILTIEGDAVELPFGTTLQRPLNAATGALRFNTDTDRFEGFYNSTWISFTDWSIIDNRPTTLSGYGITDAVSNTLGTPGIIQDIFANRPAAGTTGRLFIDTTNNVIQRDTGTTWETIGTYVQFLNDLSDVVLSTPSTNQVLQYDGVNWVNSTIPLGSVTSVAVGSTTLTITGSPITTSGTITVDLPNVGTSGTYVSVTTDAQGRVTSGSTTQAWSTITSTPTTLSGYGITDAQPLSTSLTNLSSLPGNGIVVQTNATTFTNRSIDGTTNQITLTNGDGVSGNPTISISNNPVIPGTASLTIPTGTTAQRPGTPTNGMVRYNTTTKDVEFYEDDKWVNHVREDVLFDQREPTGFIDRTTSTISFDDTTRTFTIAPVGLFYEYFYRGERVRKTTPDTVIIPDVEGTYYFYFDSNKILQQSTTIPDFSTNVLISFMYWNADDNVTEFFADERHGITMDGATHRYLHFTQGFQWVNGADIGNFTITGTGNANTDAQFSLSNGRFYDEDLIVNINHATTPTNAYEQTLTPVAKCRITWLVGTDKFRSTLTPQDYPVILDTNRIFYNFFDGSNWSRVEASEGYFVAAWVFASNALLNPIGVLMGQRQDATLNDADVNNALSSLNLSHFEIPEIKPLYRLIFQTSSTYTNAVKARLVRVDDLRLIQTTAVGISSGTQVHGDLSGLLNDDHPQYVHTSQNRTITAVHTLNPTSPGAPFILGTNANNQLVTGLNADLLDGLDSTAFQPIDSDLTALANTTTTGLYVRTGSGTSVTRTITAGANIAVTNGNGISGNPTIAFNGTLPIANGGTGTTTTPTNGQLLIGNGSGYTVATLTAGSGISITNGAGSITIAGNTGTVTSVAATAPAAGLTISGSPITTSGTLTFALANDLAAVEGLSGTGIAVRTGTDTWNTRTITGTTNQITVTNGDGVSGNPALSIPSTFVAPGSVQVTTQLYQTVAATVTAAGATQGTATELTARYNIVTTVPSGTGVRLPVPVSPFGSEIYVTNRGANNLNVYPNASASIENGSVNAAVILPPGQQATFVSSSATQWWAIEPIVVAGTNVSLTTGPATLTVNSSGATPGGVNTNIQYNNNGVFGGAQTFNYINGAPQRVESRGTDLTTQLVVGLGNRTYSTAVTDGSNNATVYIQNNGDATSEGLRCHFRRSSPGISGWITYDYDQNTPNLRLTDEDDDPPYVQFNIIGSGSYSSPQFMNLFSGRGTYGNGTTGFAWRIAQNVTNVTGMQTTPVMELDSQWLRVPSGTTAQRPGTPTNGMVRYNSSERMPEFYRPNVWVRATGVIDKTTILQTVTNTGPTNILSYTVPGGTLGTDGILRLRMQGDVLNSSGANRTITVSVTYGGTTMYSDATGNLSNGSRTGFSIELFLAPINSTTEQSLTGVIVFGNTGAVTTGIIGNLDSGTAFAQAVLLGNTASVNSAANQSFNVAVTFSGTGVTLRKFFHVLELL
jgi:hypothetical protein